MLLYITILSAIVYNGLLFEYITLIHSLYGGPGAVSKFEAVRKQL